MFTKIVFFLFLLVPFKILAQGEIAILPVYNPSHVQLKVISGERILSQQDKLFKGENKIKIEAFAIDGLNDKSLNIPQIEINLIRKGQKIAGITSNQEVNLEALMEIAQTGDVFHFQAHRLFFKNKEGKWNLYTNGRINLIYTYAGNEEAVKLSKNR